MDVALAQGQVLLAPDVDFEAGIGLTEPVRAAVVEVGAAILRDLEGAVCTSAR